MDAFNQGDYEETFNVTVYANDTLIGSFTNLTLSPRNSATISLIGNTSTLVTGTYRLVVTLDPVLGENATIDNTFLGGQILVSIPGDINGDFIVDIYDAILLAGAYNSVPTSLNWKANADINSDKRARARARKHRHQRRQRRRHLRRHNTSKPLRPTLPITPPFFLFHRSS